MILECQASSFDHSKCSVSPWYCPVLGLRFHHSIDRRDPAGHCSFELLATVLGKQGKACCRQLAWLQLAGLWSVQCTECLSKQGLSLQRVGKTRNGCANSKSTECVFIEGLGTKDVPNRCTKKTELSSQCDQQKLHVDHLKSGASDW